MVNVRGRQTSSSSRSKPQTRAHQEDTVGIQNMECGEALLEPEGLDGPMTLDSHVHLWALVFSSVRPLCPWGAGGGGHEGSDKVGPKIH